MFEGTDLLFNTEWFSQTFLTNPSKLKLRIHEQYFCCDGYAMGDNSIVLPSHKVATPAIFHLQYMSS